MTDQPAAAPPEPDAESDDAGFDPLVTPPTDWLLQFLLVFVNRQVFSFGITLQCEGILVTGQLVSGREYMDGVKAEMSSNGGQFIADLIEERVGDLYPSEPPTVDDGFRPQELYPQFVHLRDARFIVSNGAPIPTNRGVWWRGRLSTVSGYTIGVMAGDQL
jgi:hypothetical protein